MVIKTKRKKRNKRTKKKSKLPKLVLLNYKNKKHKYRLSDSNIDRRKAIDAAIQTKSNKGNKNKTIRDFAISKKRRLNVLRIYRKNNQSKECKRLTQDMKYIDRKYKLGKTQSICNF